MPHLVSLSVDGGVGEILLTRPPMNALSAQLQGELAAVAAQVADRRDIRAVVVSGGPRIFCAGADVDEMANWSSTEMTDRSRQLQSALSAIAQLPQPTVAAISGYALGGGLELALCCDARVAGDNAKLGLPEIRLGIIPGAGGTQRLPRLVGASRAKDLVFTGRSVDAEEAAEMGLVDRVVAPDHVEAAARDWAEQFVKGPAYALRAAKECIDAALVTDLEAGMALERAHLAGLFATTDRSIGMSSFISDGPGAARFEGR